MYGIKFLTGPLAGQVHPIHSGPVRIGRLPHNQIVLDTPGVSKEHLEVYIQGDRIFLKDLNSSNGTFVNGIRVQYHQAKVGDRVAVHQVMFEIVPYFGKKQLSVMAPRAPTSQVPVVAPDQSLAIASGTQQGEGFGFGQLGTTEGAPGEPNLPPVRPKNPRERVNKIVEEVVMPAVYQLPQTFDFRAVLGGFVVLFIVAVTLLSLIPMKRITSDAIANESYRRSLTVARSVAAANERQIRSQEIPEFSAELTIKEEGIADVYVISREGVIVAPAERVGTVPKEINFARRVRGLPKEFSEQTLTGEVIAAVPILIFDPELQQNVAKAHAVVVVDSTALKYDDERVFSLFVQTLFFAVLLGAGLFFLLFKLIERPFQVLNAELDAALRDGRDEARIDFKLGVVNELMTNINSLLTRAAMAGKNDQPLIGKGARDQEIHNIMQMVGYPCLLISRDGVIKKVNRAFEELSGLNGEQLEGSRVAAIPDQAMQANINHLMNQSLMNLNDIQTDQLDLGGHMFSLNCQGLSTPAGDLEYYLISISPFVVSEGGAA